MARPRPPQIEPFEHFCRFPTWSPFTDACRYASKAIKPVRRDHAEPDRFLYGTSPTGSGAHNWVRTSGLAGGSPHSRQPSCLRRNGDEARSQRLHAGQARRAGGAGDQAAMAIRKPAPIALCPNNLFCAAGQFRTPRFSTSPSTTRWALLLSQHLFEQLIEPG